MTEKPKLPFRTPALRRVDQFKHQRPDIPILPWHETASGKWECQEPGQEKPVQWISLTALMDHLESEYPHGS